MKEIVLPCSGPCAGDDGTVCQLEAVQLHTEALGQCYKVPATPACLGFGHCLH